MSVYWVGDKKCHLIANESLLIPAFQMMPPGSDYFHTTSHIMKAQWFHTRFQTRSYIRAQSILFFPQL